jgi:Uma2 family endonuclease
MENELKEPALVYGNRLSSEDYLNLVNPNGTRYEYWEGELIEMAGTTIRHNIITGNLYNSLRANAKKNECKVFFIDVNVSLKQDHIYVLPDIVYTCNEEDKNSPRIIKNPVILMEVISESTELHDRKRKWNEYRRLKSLRYYLMVSQENYLVEMYSWKNERSLFSYQVFEGLDCIISFEDLGFNLSMKEIYDDVLITDQEE